MPCSLGLREYLQSECRPSQMPSGCSAPWLRAWPTSFWNEMLHSSWRQKNQSPLPLAPCPWDSPGTILEGLAISFSRGSSWPWWATVHGVTESQTRLRDWHFHFTFSLSLSPPPHPRAGQPHPWCLGLDGQEIQAHSGPASLERRCVSTPSLKMAQGNVPQPHPACACILSLAMGRGQQWGTVGLFCWHDPVTVLGRGQKRQGGIQGAGSQGRGDWEARR